MKHTIITANSHLSGTDISYLNCYNRLHSVADCSNLDYNTNSFFEFCTMLKKHKESLLSNLSASSKSLVDPRIEEKELSDLWLNVLVEECLNYHEAAGICNKKISPDVCRIVADIMEAEKIASEASGFVPLTHEYLIECSKKTHGHSVSDEMVNQTKLLQCYTKEVEAFIARERLLVREEIRQMYESLCSGAIPMDLLAVENRLRLGKILQPTVTPSDVPVDNKPEVSEEVLSTIRSEIEGLKFNVGTEQWVKGFVLVCSYIRLKVVKPGTYGVEGTLNAYAYWILENVPMVGKVYTHEQLVKVLGKSEPYSANSVKKVLGDDPKEFIR